MRSNYFVWYGSFDRRSSALSRVSAIKQNLSSFLMSDPSTELASDVAGGAAYTVFSVIFGIVGLVVFVFYVYAWYVVAWYFNDAGKYARETDNTLALITAVLLFFGGPMGIIPAFILRAHLILDRNESLRVAGQYTTPIPGRQLYTEKGTHDRLSSR